MAALGGSYRKLWTADGLSNVADGMFQLALPLFALRITRSPAAIAGLAFAARVPWLVLGVVSGTVADRLDRRTTMVRVDVARAALIGALAIVLVLDRGELWLLYAVALALGAGETLFDTSSMALLPAIVQPDDLSRANSRLFAVEMGMNQFVGPPLAGLLAGVTISLAFTTSAAAYLAAAAILLTLPGTFRADAPGGVVERNRLRQDMAEGLRYLTQHRLLRTLTAMVGISMLSSAAAISLLPVFSVAPGPLGLTEFQFGLLLTSAAAGSLVSSLVADRVEQRLGRQRVLLICILTDGIAIAVLAVGVVPVAVAVGVALGFSQILWQVVTVTLRQRIVPNHLLGRVSGAHRTVALGSLSLGAAAGGALGEAFGIRVVFVAAGMATLSLLLLLPFVSDRALKDAPT